MSFRYPKGGFIQYWFNPINTGQEWLQNSGMWALEAWVQAQQSTFIQDLYAWGANSNAQLGQNNFTARSSPIQVGTLSTWKTVSAGAYNSAGILNDNSLRVWGFNDTGALGTNNVVRYSAPVQVNGSWLAISLTAYNSLSLKTDNSMWSSGSNDTGQLGGGLQRSSPAQIGALTTWVGVNIYSNNLSGSAIAVKNDGTLWAWGANDFGGLGTNNTTTYYSPVQVGALTNWKQAVVGGGGSIGFGIKTDGTMWSWGSNASGILGINDGSGSTRRSSPVQIGSSTDWSFVATGGGSGYAIKTNGTMWAWGSNSNGALGINSSATQSAPIQIGALTTWKYVSAYDTTAVALKNDGSIWAWGYNTNGQLGQNNLIARSSPVQVGSYYYWNSASTGGTHVLASTKYVT